MNASFIVAGLLTVAGVGLLLSVWPDTNTATVGVLLWILAGAGKVLVGWPPANENLPLHQIGTVNLPLGSVAILLLALADPAHEDRHVRHRRGGFRVARHRHVDLRAGAAGGRRRRTTGRISR
ncbi:hypothetical protein [Kutzneria kofuensis]|uniref:hypothetical protein n=1 Tax=Kutzneria kofuensis TaxID=103725 RepID=UPI0031EE9962